jgi:hypothetical protein
MIFVHSEFQYPQPNLSAIFGFGLPKTLNHSSFHFPFCKYLMPIFHRKIHRSYLDAQARAIANFINLQMVTSKKYFYSESYCSPILYFVLRASVTPSPFVSFYENKCLLVEKSLKPPFENGGNLRLRRFYTYIEEFFRYIHTYKNFFYTITPYIYIVEGNIYPLGLCELGKLVVDS